MPKQTFFNLPEEKRKRIIDAAIKEFSIYSFSKSSVNRIVKNSGIAKGSFYQYFEDKKDLYKYIINLIANVKMQYLNDVAINSNDSDFFSLMRRMVDASMKMIRDYPDFAQIGYKFLYESQEFIEDIIGDLDKKGENFMEMLIERSKEKNEIYENLDTSFLSFLISKMNYFILEYIKKFDLNDISWEEMAKISNQIIFILENGIRRGNDDKN
ncbi:TetR/AcrR family transcriptional regulator [Marinitoga arctica]